MRTMEPGTERPPDTGSATVIALVATMLVAALGHGVILLASSEQAIAANAHAGVETLYAADAAAALVQPELARMADWNGAIDGSAVSAFRTGPRTTLGPSGEAIDLDALTAGLQSRARTSDPWGPNNPVWRLYAYGRLDRLAPGLRNRAYVAVWVADDPAEIDGNPSVDGNRILVVRAEAFGAHRSRRSVVVTMGAPREERAGVERPRVLTWREVR